MPNCCVCGAHTDIVCVSPFGAYSQAYCREHLEKDIHPYSDIVGLFFSISAQSLDDIISECHDTITKSLEYHNKTISDVIRDASNISF